MISECPNCQKELPFTDAHRSKISTALDQLQPGKTLKFGCPLCKKPIELGRDGAPAVSPQREPAPPKPPKTAAAEGAGVPAPPQEKGPEKPPPAPPEPPDIGWLESGEAEDEQMVEDLPTAMVLVPDEAMRKSIADSLSEEDLQIFIPQDIEEAVSSMRFKDYAVVLYHSGQEDKPLDEQDFHKFMKGMSMTRRRHIYYILVGAGFHTFYDLEALAKSANVVINEKEIKFLSTIFRKGKLDHEKLFNPYVTLLKKYGKS